MKAAKYTSPSTIPFQQKTDSHLGISSIMKRQGYINVLGLSFLTLLLGAGCANTSEELADESVESSKGVTIKRVKTIKLEAASGKQLSLPAEVEPGRDAMLSSTMGGIVERIRVREGERVKKGTPLVTINARQMALLLKQARAQYEIAKFEYDQAVALGDVAPAAQVKRAENQMKLAQSGVDLAKLNLERATVYSPFEGVVTKINVELGEVTGPGLPVLRLSEENNLKVKVSISDQDIQALKNGAPVKILARGEQLSGELLPVPMVADPSTKTFMGEIQLKDSNGILSAGSMVSAEFDLSSLTNSKTGLALPQDAVLMRKAGNGVYVLREGKAKWIPIEVGSVVGNKVSVQGNALKLGDALIVQGQHGLNDGEEVKLLQ